MGCDGGIIQLGVVERPMVALDFDGPEGNTYALVGKCIRVARNAGWTTEAREAFRVEALSHDRSHALDTMFEYFEVYYVQKFGAIISRDNVS